MRPETYALSPGADALILRWSDSSEDRIPAPRLRAAARDAASVRRRIEQGALTVAPDLTIDWADPMGAMGLNIRFSDGHDRAIYPWDYLREIAASGPETAPEAAPATGAASANDPARVVSNVN